MSVRRKRKAVPATREQRIAMTFPALDVTFDWSNDKWAATLAPRVRMAVLTLQRDDKELERIVATLIREGDVPDMLEGWSYARQHFQDLVKFLDAALFRTFIVLERLGYDSENPPPDSRVRVH